MPWTRVSHGTSRYSTICGNTDIHILPGRMRITYSGISNRMRFQLYPGVFRWLSPQALAEEDDFELLPKLLTEYTVEQGVGGTVDVAHSSDEH